MPLQSGDFVVVVEAEHSPQNGCIGDIDESCATVTFPKADENRWTPLLFSGERKKLPIHDRNILVLERDFVLLHDNFKTIWGPPDLMFQGRQFGVRFAKRKQPTVESGLQLDLSPTFPDPLVVIGLAHHYQKTNRKTSVQLILFWQKRMELRFLEYCTFSKIFVEDRSRVLDITPESRLQASEGRHLMSVVANGSVPPPSISQGEIFRSVAPLRGGGKRKRVSLNAEPEGLNFFGFIAFYRVISDISMKRTCVKYCSNHLRQY